MLSHHYTLLGCLSSPRAAVGWGSPQAEGIQGTPILPGSLHPTRLYSQALFPCAPPPADFTSGCSQEKSEEQGPTAQAAGLWDRGDTHVAVEEEQTQTAGVRVEQAGLRECRDPAVHTACRSECVRNTGQLPAQQRPGWAAGGTVSPSR